jgi:hypothetical protein
MSFSALELHSIFNSLSTVFITMSAWIVYRTGRDLMCSLMLVRSLIRDLRTIKPICAGLPEAENDEMCVSTRSD